MRHLAIVAWLFLVSFAPTVFADEPAAEAPTRSGVLLLKSQPPDMTVEKASGKLLIRELLRQAILIAGRDQLGLATRDMTLREPFPDGPVEGQRVLDVLTARAGGKFVRVTVTGDNDQQKLYADEFSSPVTELDDFDYLGLVVAAEGRSREQFVQALRDAGFAGEPNRANPDVQVSSEIENLLSEMNSFSQFDAVRRLHQIQQTEGESRATLGALVRGYANLGQLTQFHWNASHKVYKARALLYAQRLVVTDNDSAWAHWHRAYALAMTGLHYLALGELELADQQREKAMADGQEVEPPSWVPLISGCCRYDTDELKAEAEKATADRQLAWFLTCLTVESAHVATTYALSLAREGLEAAPDCLRIVDAMCLAGGVSNLHFATVYGPQVFAASLPFRLATMPGLPPDLPRILPDREELARRMASAGDGQDITVLMTDHPRAVERLLERGAAGVDRGEPSWSALARLIEDVDFAQLVRRGNFFTKQWGVPVDQLAEHATPIVAAHPYRALIETAALDPTRDRRRYWEHFQDLNYIDAELTGLTLIQRTWNSPHRDRTQGSAAFGAANEHRDNTARELELAVLLANEKNTPGLAKGLLAASPYSPLAAAALVEHDPDAVADRIDEWDRDYGQHPVVMGALFRHYKKVVRPDDAKRCLTRYLERSKDLWAVTELADLQLAEGDEEGFVATLEEVLDQPDFGLSHASVQVKLANYFMDREEWEKAQPYADGAAESGAGWAMMCAARCYEGLGDLRTAEKYVAATATRYSGSATRWYYWCQNTGYGDLDQARDLALAYFQALQGRQTLHDVQSLAIIHSLEGETEEAIQHWRQSLTRNFFLYSAMQMALLYDQLDNSQQRDLALRHVVERGEKLGERQTELDRVCIGVAKMIRQMCETGEFTYDDEELARVLAKASPTDVANAQYFLGRILEHHGQTERGRELLQRCADSNQTEAWTFTQARVFLRNGDEEAGE